MYLPHLQGREGGGEGEGSRRQDTEEGMGSAAASLVQKGGHWLKCSGNLVWCVKCACFAHKRFGVGLKGRCRPAKTGAVRARLARLHMGFHPVTGVALREAEGL